MKLICFFFTLCCIGHSFVYATPETEIIQMSWTKSYGGDAHETVHAMLNTSDGGQILVGTTASKGIGKTDGWIFKVDETGEIVWERTIGGKEDDTLLDIVANDKGGYMLTGTTFSKGHGSADIWLVRIDEVGNMDWNIALGTTKTEKGGEIIKNADGEYVIAGTRHLGNYTVGDSSRRYELAHYIWLMKFDDEANLLWDERVHVDAMLYITDLHQTQDGGYILSAISKKDVKNDEDSFIMKMDNEGLVMWKKWLGQKGVPDMIHGILPMTNGTFLLAGISINKNNEEDANGWLLLMDGMGYVTWEKFYGNIGKGGDEFHAINRTKDNYILLAGLNGESSLSEGSMWMLKAKRNGDIVWEQKFGQQAIERAYVVSVNRNNEILVAGNSDLHAISSEPAPTDNHKLAAESTPGNVRLVKYAPKKIQIAPKQQTPVTTELFNITQ